MISVWRISSESLLALAAAFAVSVSGATVTGRVDVLGPRNPMGNSGVAIWLEPKDDPLPALRPSTARMVQHGKQFQPHVLAIPIGTTVDFPNLDPIFHSAFSNVDGQQFDLALYPPGTSRRVVFHKAGIVHVFCNIHESMSAVIVVEDTPWMTVSSRDGSFAIPRVPSGRYTLHIFYERATKEMLDGLERTIEVGEETLMLPEVRILPTGNIEAPHKNKYGLDYPPDTDNGYGSTP